jgi:hypothetical protein
MNVILYIFLWPKTHRSHHSLHAKVRFSEAEILVERNTDVRAENEKSQTLK